MVELQTAIFWLCPLWDPIYKVTNPSLKGLHCLDLITSQRPCFMIALIFEGEHLSIWILKGHSIPSHNTPATQTKCCFPLYTQLPELSQSFKISRSKKCFKKNSRSILSQCGVWQERGGRLDSSTKQRMFRLGWFLYVFTLYANILYFMYVTHPLVKLNHLNNCKCHG
jgi:hypothetical protein